MGKQNGKLNVKEDWKVLSLPLFCWCCSVIQSCPALCDSMDCKTPGFPLLHRILEFAQTRVHWVSDAIQASHPLLFFFSCLQSFPSSGSFPMSQFFTSNGQSIRVSASASVLPMNIQDYFPLGWTGWISLLSKELSSVSSNITVQRERLYTLCL